MTYKKHLKKKSKRYEKIQNLILISNLLKCTKKVISKTSFKNMSKSGKSSYIRHVFASNFFGTFFLLFQQIRSQRENKYIITVV